MNLNASKNRSSRSDGQCASSCRYEKMVNDILICHPLQLSSGRGVVDIDDGGIDGSIVGSVVGSNVGSDVGSCVGSDVGTSVGSV